MADREKIIKGLECCADDEPFYHAYCDVCPYNGRKPDNIGGCTKLYRDALELLKEQAELVRCKDCKYNEHGRCEKDNIRAHMVDCGDNPSFYVYNDWFCAYGERR